MVKRRLWVAFLFAIVVTPVRAEPVRPVSEYAVKAAYLFNFTKFVEWPPGAIQKTDGVFVIGILGQDPFGQSLEDQFNGKIVQEKKLVFTRLSGVEEASGCQVVFIPASESERLGAILSSLRHASILTVSDMDRFIQRGGMVGFTIEKNKVRFGVNLTPAQTSGLKISSQLLKLATVIEGKQETGNE